MITGTDGRSSDPVLAPSESRRDLYFANLIARRLPLTHRTQVNAVRRSVFLPALRGAGQILFQPSALTGAGFLLLVLAQSPYALALCVAGLTGATLCAAVLEPTGEAFTDGVGGFNGALLGLALSAFFAPSALLLAVCFTGGLLTGVVRVALLRLLPVPPFTMPYILVTWLAEYGCRHQLAMPPLPAVATTGASVQALATNASQVLFSAAPWIAPLVVLAVLLCSRAAALWVAASSLIAWLTTLALSPPAGLTADGLLGYNALILASAL